MIDAKRAAMSDPAAPSGWDLAALASGALAMLVAIGHGLRWLLTWTDRRAVARAERLAREEDELAESWSSYRKRVAADLTEAMRRIDDLERRDIVRAKENAALRVAFELVAAGLRVLDPNNISLRQAEQILATTFKLEPQLPLDMTQAIAALGEVPGTDDR